MARTRWRATARRGPGGRAGDISAGTTMTSGGAPEGAVPHPSISRRQAVWGAASILVASALPRGASARGRAPYGGRILMHVPWPLASVDPHRIDDPAAALFG